MKGLFHVHSRHSFDSCLSVKRIVEYAVRGDFEILSITDHNTIRGSLEARDCNRSHKLNIIIGAEYATDCGDITGIFLRDEVKTRDAHILVKEIRGQGGLVVLPHPFRGHKLDDELLGHVDLVEVYNCRAGNEANRQAQNLGATSGKSLLAGSDAHFRGELGLAAVRFHPPYDRGLKDILLTNGRDFEVRPSPSYYQALNCLVGGFKTGGIRNPWRMMVSVLNAICVLLRPAP